jgi:hypothetical protein
MTPRLEVPLHEWPEIDRTAWRAAVQPTESLFDEAGGASAWRKATQEISIEVFGLWLGFLESLGITGFPSAIPLMTPEQRDGFTAAQTERNVANLTIRKRLERLKATFDVMVPGQDFGFVLRPFGRRLSQALPGQPCPVSTRDSRDIFERALALHADGLAGKGYAKGLAARRDGLIIALLACCAERVGVFSRTEIGFHLVRRAEGYWLQCSGD